MVVWLQNIYVRISMGTEEKPRPFSLLQIKDLIMDQNMEELLKSQRGLICARTGHTKHIALPVQKDDAQRKVLCRCTTCERDFWVELPEEGYNRFLADFAAGRIK